MVDGVLLLVDASRGAAAADALRPAQGARGAPAGRSSSSTRSTGPTRASDEVVDEVYELFLDLDADEDQIEFPIVYTQRPRRAGPALEPDGARRDDLEPLLDLLLATIPPPAYDPEHPLQALVTNLDASPYVGRLALCRSGTATIREGRSRSPGAAPTARSRTRRSPSSTSPRRSTASTPTRPARARSSPSPASPEVTIGETLADPEDPRPLPVITVDEPSLSMTIGINTSPLAGSEGDKADRAPGAGAARRRSWSATSRSASHDTERPDAWEVQGRGELQLAVLVEMMRREGFELTVGKPQVLTREIDGKLHEPVERVAIDVPEEYVGVVTQLLALRKGRAGADGQPRHRLGADGVPRPRARADRLPHRVPDRDARHRDPAPRLRALGAVARRAAHPADRLRSSPTGAATATGFALAEPAGARHAVRRPRRRGLRGHDRRRERALRGPRRERDARRRSSRTCARRPPTSSSG